MGTAFNGKLLVVVHTDRGNNIRIISVRRANRRERRFMKKKPNNGMRDEYDFAHGRRGKYAKRYAEGTNVVVLAPDVARIFSTSKKVNSSRKLIRAEAST